MVFGFTTYRETGWGQHVFETRHTQGEEIMQLSFCTLMRNVWGGLQRSGYLQSAYELERQGLHQEAAVLRREAIKDV